MTMAKTLIYGFLSLIDLEKFSTFIDQLHFENIDPEAYMTIEEIIKFHGYPVKSYDIQTDDGYIITVQRIPYGKTKRNEEDGKKSVLIQHGFLSQSSSWLLNPPQSNLPYILADAGYDVWLGNTRGNSFGKKHIKLSPEDKEFWNYSVDEMIKYDIPKIIDTILEKSKSSQLYYIGFSLGTTLGLAVLSSQPKYNEIIKGAFLMAPTITIQHTTSEPVKFLFSAEKNRIWLLYTFFNNQFPRVTQPILNILGKTLCHFSFTRFLCEDLIYFTCGEDKPQFNARRLPVYLRHTLGSTSVRTIRHISQTYKSGVFRNFDFTPARNLKIYEQETPRNYNVSKITAPIYLFWSDNDVISNPTDVNILEQKLCSLALSYRVQHEKFNHMDFLVAVDVKYLVYDKLLDEINKLDHR